MKLFANSTVTWQSEYNKQKAFKGVILRMFYSENDPDFLNGIALVDDGSGFTPRCIPQTKLTVVKDPTRLTMRK